MAALTLPMAKRDPNQKAKNVRKNGKIPSVLYGHEQANQTMECVEREFHKVYMKAGESTIVELEIGKKHIPVLIHDIQFDPVTGAYAHIDFFAPDMTKEVTARVPIRTINISPAVKELGGVLVRNCDHLTVKCLPKDLPHDIEVDIASLQNFFDNVTVDKLSLPHGVHVLEDVKTIIVSVVPPRKEEEELPAPTAAAEGAEGAVAAEGTAEGTMAGAEGASPVKEDTGKKNAAGKKEPKPKK